MKTLCSALCMIALGFTPFFCASAAETGEPAPWMQHADLDGDGALSDDERARAQRLFKRLDRNGDGRLDERERQLANEIKRRIDLNGDGKIDEQERAQAQQKRAQLRARIDTDGDGEISESEKQAAREKWRMHQMKQHGANPATVVPGSDKG